MASSTLNSLAIPDHNACVSPFTSPIVGETNADIEISEYNLDDQAIEDSIFATIRAQYRPAMWNQAELSEEVDLDIDVVAEFQSAMSGYFAKMASGDAKFAMIRAQYRPAMWNQAELSEEVDLDIDVDAEFQSAVSGYFAKKASEDAKFAMIRAQYRPAMWNQAELSACVDADLDYQHEFEVVCREHWLEQKLINEWQIIER
jgi:hypothetical protein